MIRKIQTNPNITNTTKDNSDNKDNNKGNLNYDTESRSTQTEELDLNSFTSESQNSTTTITEEATLNAIDQNFINNRNLTNEMTNQVYNSLKDKIAQYIKNQGGNI